MRNIFEPLPSTTVCRISTKQVLFLQPPKIRAGFAPVKSLCQFAQGNARAFRREPAQRAFVKAAGVPAVRFRVTCRAYRSRPLALRGSARRSGAPLQRARPAWSRRSNLSNTNAQRRQSQNSVRPEL